MKVVETDNRDLTTTTLVLEDGTRVDVDPIDLFVNSLENNLEGSIEYLKDQLNTVLETHYDFLCDLQDESDVRDILDQVDTTIELIKLFS